MDLYSFNCGDLYKSNYGDPSIELGSSKIELRRSINRIMEIQNWIMEIYEWIAEFNNELWNFIFRQGLRRSITVWLSLTVYLRSPETDWISSTIDGAAKFNYGAP